MYDYTSGDVYIRNVKASIHGIRQAKSLNLFWNKTDDGFQITKTINYNSDLINKFKTHFKTILDKLKIDAKTNQTNLNNYELLTILVNVVREFQTIIKRIKDIIVPKRFTV